MQDLHLKGMFGGRNALALCDLIRPERIRAPRFAPAQIFSGVDQEPGFPPSPSRPASADVGREALVSLC
jgi:hypothetical protein